MFAPAFGIRLIPAVYANDRLSPPFAVYATSTACFPLFMLEVGCELSSFIWTQVPHEQAAEKFSTEALL